MEKQVAQVAAKYDIRSVKGLRIASSGDRGRALRGHVPTRQEHYGKVAVRWGTRKKVYWHSIIDLTFLDSELSAQAYVATAPNAVIEFPEIPSPPEPHQFNFGANVKFFRNLKKLPQWRLAEKMTEGSMGVSQTTISFWERREAAPSGDYVRAIAFALDIPVFVLFINVQDCRWIEATGNFIKDLSDALCRATV